MKSRFTYANVTASVALFLALGGVSYAANAKPPVIYQYIAPANSVVSTSLRDGAVTNSKIANATITSQKLNAETIKALKGQTGDRGPSGLTGLQGLKGESGVNGAMGPKGDPGASGPQGPKGNNGQSGPLGMVKLHLEADDPGGARILAGTHAEGVGATEVTSITGVGSTQLTINLNTNVDGCAVLPARFSDGRIRGLSSIAGPAASGSKLELTVQDGAIQQGDYLYVFLCSR